MYQRAIALQAGFTTCAALPLLLLAGCGTLSSASESTPPFRYCYCLFELPGKAQAAATATSRSSWPANPWRRGANPKSLSSAPTSAIRFGSSATIP